MIWAAVAAAAAVALWLGPPPGTLRRRLRRRRVGGRREGGRWLAVCGLVGAGVLVVVVRAIGGSSPATLTAALLAVTATSTILVRAGRHRRAEHKTRRQVAHACQVLARLVAVGQVPAEALQVSASDCPVLAESAAMQAVGGDPVVVWRQQASRPGRAGLLALARAWQVSQSTGASMARPLRDVAAALAAEDAVARVVVAELSAPRATGRLLAALPLFGLVLGFLIGGNPLHFLLDNWVGQLCLIAGVLLACAGVVWVERLAVRGAVV